MAEKALQKRNEIIGYLRDLRPMVYNFPCDPFPECNAPPAEGQEQEEGTYVKLYQDIKRVYQEGLVYFFERNFVNAYVRFLDCQIRTEQLVEGLSQLYLDRTEEMLRDSIDKKYPNDPDDKTVIDISIEFGPNSKMRRDFGKKRNSPAEIRRYDPRDYHYLWFKYEIESNMERGYQYLNSAKESRTKAVKVAKELAPHEKVQPNHRKKRIEYYVQSIDRSRQAKRNAERIFQLKYPYDNYALFNQYGKTEGEGENQGVVPEIADVCMNWSKNPYVVPKALNPVFDLRLPANYRRDATDARNMVYADEIDVNINFKYDTREELQNIKVTCEGPGTQQQPAPAAGGNNNP